MGVKRKGRTKTRAANPPSASPARRRKSSIAPGPDETGINVKASPAAFPIVGIGASAGGLEAFSQLLSHLPLDTGMAFVLIAHLDPGHESALSQILARVTQLPVSGVADDQPVLPNHVYVIQPDTTLSIEQGKFRLALRPRHGIHRPIDIFLQSLAQDRGAGSIGVVLSGTGTDGTLGLEAIKGEGGITFAQDNSAKHDSMPNSAVAADCVDQVLSPAGIAQELARIAKHPYVASHAFETTMSAAIHPQDSGKPEPMPSIEEQRVASATSTQDAYQKILLLLHKHSGVDFSFYKSTTILRRIHRRLLLGRQATLTEYASFLSKNPQELEALYSDVLINVTSFFRNPEMFEVLRSEVFAELLKQPGDDPLRCWVLGCSSGQEAYSIAITFLEAVEESTRPRSLQIFATDLSEAQLNKARQGLYPKGVAEDIGPIRLRRFFEEEEDGYRVHKQLRDMVVFARQNLTNDPPFSRMDIISCRNLLIYLEPSLQKKALPTFHYALKPGGYLVLGTSESIGEFSNLFKDVDKKHKIFRKKPVATPALHLPLLRTPAAAAPRMPMPASAEQRSGSAAYGELNAHREADRVTVSRFAPPAVLVSADLQVLQFRGATGDYLEPSSGKASFNVLKMARDGLMLPLRAVLNQARKENKVTRRERVPLKQDGKTRFINLEVIPLKNLRERSFLVLFEEAKKSSARDVKENRVMERRLSTRSAKQERKRSNDLELELTETRDYLQSIQEQHEASVEALEAANEEVQSANEELQSVNEELETSKEELESSNEELITVNEEMNTRNIELNRLNNDLINFQASTRISILLLGRDLTLRRFSPQAQKQFDLVPADVGRPISHIRLGLFTATSSSMTEPRGPETPIELTPLLADVLDNMYEQEHEVRDRSGRWYSMRLRPYLTHDNRVDGAVLVLVDIDALKHGEQEMAAARYFAENAIATARQPILVLDLELRVETANPSFYQKFCVNAKQTIGRPIYELGNHQWDIPRLRELLGELLTNSTVFEDFRVEHHFEKIGHRMMLLNARRVEEPRRKHRRILLAIEDITTQHHAETELRNAQTVIAELKEQINTLSGRPDQPTPPSAAPVQDGNDEAKT